MLNFSFFFLIRSHKPKTISHETPRRAFSRRISTSLRRSWSMSARNWSSLAPIRWFFSETDPSLESKDTQKVNGLGNISIYVCIRMYTLCCISFSLSLSLKCIHNIHMSCPFDLWLLFGYLSFEFQRWSW